VHRAEGLMEGGEIRSTTGGVRSPGRNRSSTLHRPGGSEKLLGRDYPRQASDLCPDVVPHPPSARSGRTLGARTPGCLRGGPPERRPTRAPNVVPHPPFGEVWEDERCVGPRMAR
jgi:hypothetical protein